MGKVTNSLPKSLFQRVVAILETPLVYLFGRDIFISYARSDSANYAQQLAIDLRARVPKFSFFLDQWASQSGRTLPLSLRLALRWSQMLVFVGTERAIASPHVRHELETFFNRKGRFVPIDVEGVLTTAMRQDEFLAAICGPGAVLEKGENVTNSTPSEGVVTRIVNAVNFTRQDRRLRRAVVGTTLGVMAVIAAAYFVSQSIVVSAKNQADKSKKEAIAAQEQQQKALLDVGQATIAASNANADQVIARILMEQANAEARLAETKRIGAERLRDQARAEAAVQSEIATTRQRANQSELTLRQSPTRLAQSVSLAVESMNRADAIGMHSLEADRALRASLSLMPRSLGPPRTIDGNISATAFSPDGKHVAVLSKAGASGGASLLRVLKTDDGQEIASFPQDGQVLALSNDARRVAISNGRTVTTSEISGSGKWELPIENEDNGVTGIALSPDGRYLALILRNADITDRAYGEVWQVETAKRVAQLQTGNLLMESVAFSANGHFLAMGGSDDGPTGKRVGRAYVWNLRNYSRERGFTSNSFRQRDELVQDDGVLAIAAGPDDKSLATANGQMAVVWKKTNRSGYREIARMPIEQQINDLAFSADGKRLSVLSNQHCDAPNDRCLGRSLETWDSAGYWQTVMAVHDSAIETLAFQTGDEFITTIGSGYGDDNVRVWRASNGEEMKYAKLRFEEDDVVPGKSTTSNGRYIVTATQGVWHVWDLVARIKTAIPIEDVEPDEVEHSSLSPDAGLLALAVRQKGGGANALLIYKREGVSYRITKSFPLPTHATAIAISPDQNRVAVSFYQRGLKLLDIRDGRDKTPARLSELEGGDMFEFAPDGKTLAILISDGKRQTLGLWRLSDGRQIATLRSDGSISSYSFGASGNYLVASMADSTARLLNVRTGDVSEVPGGWQIKLAALSPDERFIATADVTGLVKVVELSSGAEVMHLQHDYKVTKIAFSKDGRYLATATEADKVDQADEAFVLHVWSLRPRDLIAEACQRLARFSPGPLPYCVVR